VTPDVELDEKHQTKQEHGADKKRLKSLLTAKANIDKTAGLKAHLYEPGPKIVPDLDTCINSEKRETYTYLGLKVTAIPEGAEIKGCGDYLLAQITSY
jgi:hypothetical protein